MKRRLILSLGLLCAFAQVRTEEGMWIPLLLKQYNIADMQKAGFRLTAEDVYSVNQASLKDAVVIFGGGCTGELISEQGLLITNHHCGYGNIQRHSTVEHDYLTDGFWALSREEELPNPGLSVSFLERMEDVTGKALEGIKEGLSPSERNRLIEANISRIQREASRESGLVARVASFFSGNQYFLFLYQVYPDVRLVGAPPSAIGKFGGETDNWMWPRHTGDFALFRVYAGPDNRPAAYNPANVPFKPKKHLKISLKGVQKGDFTMVFGYPGRTTEYIPSFVIENQLSSILPASVQLRTRRLDVITASMDSSAAIRIQYSAKKAGIANSWKKNQGVILGLERVGAVQKKKDYEERFRQWVESDPARRASYGDLLDRYRRVVEDQAPYERALTWLREAGEAPEIIGLAGKIGAVCELFRSGKTEELEKLIVRLKAEAVAYFRDYHAATDKKLLAVMMEAYARGLQPEFQPEMLREVDRRYKGDFARWADKVFATSPFTNVTSVNSLFANLTLSTVRRIEQDEAYRMYQSLQKFQREVIRPGMAQAQEMVPEYQRIYMKAQMEMEPGKVFYPDANSTLRVTYGRVDDFLPADGILYRHVTTLDGIMEKDNPDIYDYRVPERLKELYRTGDFGPYAAEGSVPVCFIASNHTSGGNSGSPVLDADGNLIGINFDRNWQGTMSDMMYDPDLCRNISLDIRYAVFIIDRFAGANNLIEEIRFVN